MATPLEDADRKGLASRGLKLSEHAQQKGRRDAIVAGGAAAIDEGRELGRPARS
jgi:hypothetical protein